MLQLLLPSSILASSELSNIKNGEQWKAIDLGSSNTWILVDDVQITDKGFFFQRDPESSSSIDYIGGVAWSQIQIGNKKGLRITFVPSIEVDSNFFGNVKYPQGFAIVLTSSNVTNGLKGEKGFGLGYDGINTAIAFEFDFIQQKDRNDLREPHFSVHYNLSGGISSKSPSDCKICNKKLPNFYDNTNENFDDDLKITIDLYDEAIQVYSNLLQDNVILEKTAFKLFGDLMENKQVYIGITASMNLYKSVTIKNFNLFEIIEAKEGKIELKNNKEGIKAGEAIVVHYQSLSTGGIPLKINRPEFDLIALHVNGRQIENVDMEFDMNSMALVMSTKNITKSGSYSLIVIKNNDSLSNVEQFKMISGSIEQYDLCIDTYSNYNHQPTFIYDFDNIKHDSTHFHFYICAYDQYYNKKVFTKHIKSIISLSYPHHFIPDEEYTDTSEEDKTRILIKAPFVGFGIYSIVSMDFYSVKNRVLNFNKQVIDFNASFGDVMGAITQTTADQLISFRVILKDQLNGIILKDELSKVVKCTVDESLIFPKPNKVDITYDYGYPIFSFYPNAATKYTFNPIVKCEKDNKPVTLNCLECEVYVQGDLHPNGFKIYSDYFNRYFLSLEISSGNELIVSFDEKTNRKIASILFIDVNTMDYLNLDVDKITINSILLKKKDDSISIPITTTTIPSGIDIYLNSDRTFDVLSPLLVYTLSIQINANGVSYNKDIYIKFRSKDDWLNNMTADKLENYIAVYKRNTKTIQANENILLYEMFGLNKNNEFTSNIDCNFEILVQSKPSPSETINNGYSCLIYATLKTGDNLMQSITIKHNQQEILKENLLIINSNQIGKLKLLNMAIEDTDNVTLEDVDLFKFVSFSLQMIDIYGNPITMNPKEVFNLLSIELTNTSVELRLNGIINVSSNNYIRGEQGIKFTLPNGNTKTIKYKRIGNSIDPTTSNALVEYLSTSSTISKEAKIIITLKDSNYNQLSNSIITTNDDVKSKINVIAVKPNYSFIVCNYKQIESSTYSILSYLCIIPQKGEYFIQVYYDNVPLLCQGCIINASGETSLDAIDMYIIGNKKNIPVFTSVNKYQIADKTKPLSIILDMKNNESIGESYSLTITNEVNLNYKARFCSLKDTSEEIRHVYTICSDSIESFNNLPNGNYIITVNTKSFKIFLTDEIFDKSEEIKPSNEYSMIMNPSNIIVGTIDRPGISVLDIRSVDKHRFFYIDLSRLKVKLDGKTTDASQLFFNNEKGLITALINHSSIGEFQLEITYNDQTIIDGYTYVNYPGSLNSLSLFSDSAINYSEANYILLQAKDNKENKCGSSIELQSSTNIHNIINISQQNRFVNTFKTYNPVTGVIAIKLDKNILGSLNVISDYSLGKLYVNIEPELKPENIYAHLDKDDQIIRIFAIGEDNKEIPFDKVSLMLNTDTVILDVLIFNNENDKYEYSDTLRLMIDSVNQIIKFSISELKMQGDYNLIPLYLETRIQCSNCHLIVKNPNQILNLSNTLVFLKDGANNWLETNTNNKQSKILFKKSVPLFKIQFTDTQFAQMAPIQDNINYILKTSSSEEILLESYTDLNKDVYVFISNIDHYFKLSSRFIFTLEIKYESQTISFGDFYVLDSVKIDTKQICFDNSINIDIINSQTLYQLRPTEELVLELKLNGCKRKENDFINLDDLHVELPQLGNWSYKLLHSDYSDFVLLFLKAKTVVVTENKQIISVNYKESTQCLNVNIQLLPDTIPYLVNIDQSRLSYTISDTHAYFYLKVLEEYNNQLPSPFNPILNSMNIATVKDSKGSIVPYKITIDTSETEYNIIGEINIYSIEKYTIDLNHNSKESYYLDIKCSDLESFSNSFASLIKTGIDNQYEMTITLKDSKNTELSASTCNIDYLSTFTFYYYSIDQFNGESFSFHITDAKIKNEKNPNVITLTLSEDLPKYQYYTTIAYYNSNPLVCNTCMFKNDKIPLIYGISLNEYYSSIKLSQPLTIESKIEHLFLMVYSFKNSINIEADGVFKYGETEYAYNKCKIKYIGFNTFQHFDQILPDQVTLTIDTTSKLTVIFHKEYKISLIPPSLNNISLFGKQSYSFIANEPFSFYIELRDKDNILTSASTNLDLLSQLPEIYSLLMIPSSVEGIYYVIITTQTVIKANHFFIEISEGRSAIKAFINSKPAFPSSINVKEESVITSLLTRITISSIDIYSNSICDKRIELIVSDKKERYKQYEIYTDSKANCVIDILFSGISYIQIPLLSMNKIAIYNMKSQPNPFNSSLKITPTVVTPKNELLSLDFSIALDSGFTYVNTMSIHNLRLNVYKIISDTKYQLIQELKGLYSMSYKFTPEQLTMEIENEYAFVGIINNKLFTQLNIIKYSNSNTVLSSITLFSHENNILTQLPITNDKSISEDQFIFIEMPYPLNLKIFFLNESKVKIEICKTKIATTELFSKKEDKSIISLNAICDTDGSLSITIKKSDIDKYLHLPKGSYYLKFIINNDTNSDNNYIINYLHLDKTISPYHIDISNAPYDIGYDDQIPSTIINEFGIITQDNDKLSIYNHLNNYSKSVYCFIRKENSENLIYNDYIKDPSSITIQITNNKCPKHIISPSYRGCISLYTKCVSNDNNSIAEVKYNNVLLGGLIIKVDEELPTSTEYEITDIKEFNPPKDSASFIEANFNIINTNTRKKINSINRNRFKVIINGDIIPFSLYAYSFITKHIISISNIYYPPTVKRHIKVYFTDQQAQYLLSALTKEIEVKPDLSAVNLALSVPLTYYAGDELAVYIQYKDKMSYCVNNEIDENLSYVITGSKGFLYKDFEHEMVSISSFIKCSQMIKIKPKNNISPLVKAEIYTFTITDTTEDKEIASAILNVQPNNISENETTMTAVGYEMLSIISVKAGREIALQLIPLDAHQNKIDLDTIYSLPELLFENLTKDDYAYSVYKTTENITIKVTIFKIGEFKPILKLNNEEYNTTKGIKQIIIKPGDCYDNQKGVIVSKEKAEPGDNILITLQCYDQYNNKLTSKGDEQFTVQIQGSDLEIIREDLDIPYTFTYTTLHNIEFLLIYSGKYVVKIYLNGKEYYHAINIDVNSPRCNPDEYMCVKDKKCVTSLTECSEFIERCTYEQINNGEFNACSVDGVMKNCVKVEECDCKEDYSKCDGTCLLNNDNYCLNKKSSNCVDVVKARYGLVDEVNDCKDGSCRIDKCPMSISCPIGYHSLEFTCIPFTDISNKANEEIPSRKSKCEENEVKCWDLSCSNSYENCPTKKTCSSTKPILCPDGLCVKDSNKCHQPPKCNGDTPVLCSDFTCKKEIKECLKNPTCPLGLSLCENNQCLQTCDNVSSCKDSEIRCPNGQCVSNSYFCASSMYCPKEYIKCSNGGCAKSINTCDFIEGVDHIICPLKEPILCPDLSCVDNSDKCNEIPSCPTSLPFRCWNNDCKANKEQCSTKVKCPNEYPILCCNGKCTKASYHCESVLNSSSEEGSIRCSDGSIVSTVSLCPTLMNCGDNMLICWNGSCADKIEHCPTPKTAKCPNENPYVCPDGSCRPNKDSCSTISICPKERPIKCYDNLCREDISLCPDYQSCGLMKNCPDGTCASSFDECNTIVTCTKDRPFLCYDNSCAKSIEDCPKPEDCKGKILCPDGICVSNRQNCKLLNSCPTKNPIKCAVNICSSTLDECINSNKECPIGYSKCPSGECKTNESYCSQIHCPKHMPVLCSEGVCVSKKEYCDMPNGCPYNKIDKCSDGQCVVDMKNCANHVECQTQLCPDGSCLDKGSTCPLINGCPKERPTRCADGTCINGESSQCNPPLCPYNYPIKCANGNCVEASYRCVHQNVIMDMNDCKTENLSGFMCADGRCVDSLEYCRPIHSCSLGYVKCNDGSCRISQNLCPLGNNCPKSRPIKCPGGICIREDQNCYSGNVCLNDEIYCISTGTCISKDDECPELQKPNGCPLTSPYKCDDGRCFDLESKCLSVNIACNEETPILCPNGECKLSLSECNKLISCIERCDNGQCVPKGELKKCVNLSGCSEYMPYRCNNGECVANPTECPTTISCDASAPFMCGNKSCVTKETYCPIVVPCSKTLCSNHFCVDSKEDCDQYSKYCPIYSPIKCPNGRCVKAFNDCSLSYISETCTKGEFYCNSKTKCVNNVKECFGELAASGEEANSFNALFSSTKTENGCSSKYPYSCYDGTCAESANSCSLFPTCDIFEYKCPNGSCQSDLSKCTSNEDVTCVSGLNKCEDGLCRTNCREYKGCPINMFQCTNGMCVLNKLECIGYSMCPDSKIPYRCINGKCVENPQLCPDINRLNTIHSFSHSFDIHNTFTVNFASDKHNRNVGSLTIPGNALIMNKEGNEYGEIYIKEISHSLHHKTVYESNTYAKYNISTGIPGSDGVLKFENAVVSPIISIEAPTSNTQLNLPGLLFLEYNTYTSDEFTDEDYCLSKLVQNGTQDWWNCTERANSVLDYSFQFNSFGTYAVILNPNRRPNDSMIDENSFFLNNIMNILITLAVLIVGGVIVFYIFSRVIRYKQKYQENVAKMNLLKKQKEEYEMMSTDVFGQTLGDSILGLTFTKNCLYNLEKRDKENESSMEQEIDNLQLKCKEMEDKNRLLQKEMDGFNKQYKELIYEINELKK